MGMVTTGGLSFVGDVICQNIEFQYFNNNMSGIKAFEWNYIRSLKFGFVGITYGPQIAFWYKTLATKIFPGQEAIGLALKRMMLDQTLFASYSICYWIPVTTLLVCYFFNFKAI